MIKLGLGIDEAALKFFLSERSQKFTNKASRGFSCDVAKTFLVIYPEGILQFSLHGLHIWILNQEGGAELTELGKLNLTRTILVNLKKKFLQLLLSGSEAHGSHDLTKIISRQEIDFLCVKQIKAGLQTLDLISSQTSGFIDVIEVNTIVVCHSGWFDSELLFRGLKPMALMISP